MIGNLSRVDPHPPTLADQKILALLYADNTVWLSRTPVGLRRALKEFGHYHDMNELVISYQKTKVMSIGVRPKVRMWSINGHRLEQVLIFKYLAVVIQSLGARKAHHEYATHKG